MIDQEHVNNLKAIVGEDYITTSKPIRISYLAESIMDLDSETADIVIGPNL
jgi:hypothetical protein